mmetsp:Transcript_13152/g.26447  ORF Transcript_13152/g.26447 Transcript_13152/m.26447 type:complete len:278 (-) Transcript_13152:1181-2014(-)
MLIPACSSACMIVVGLLPTDSHSTSLQPGFAADLPPAGAAFFCGVPPGAAVLPLTPLLLRLEGSPLNLPSAVVLDDCVIDPPLLLIGEPRMEAGAVPARLERAEESCRVAMSPPRGGVMGLDERGVDPLPEGADPATCDGDLIPGGENELPPPLPPLTPLLAPSFGPTTSPCGDTIAPCLLGATVEGVADVAGAAGAAGAEDAAGAEGERREPLPVGAAAPGFSADSLLARFFIGASPLSAPLSLEAPASTTFAFTPLDDGSRLVSADSCISSGLCA